VQNSEFNPQGGREGKKERRKGLGGSSTKKSEIEIKTQRSSFCVH
jgi:hypothetical protein